MNNTKVEKRPYGWYAKSIKGTKLDKTSESFKRWFEKNGASKRRAQRRKLEALAKAPLPGRIKKTRN